MAPRRSDAAVRQVTPLKAVPIPVKKKTKRRQPPQKPIVLSPELKALPSRLTQAREALGLGVVDAEARCEVAMGVLSKLERNKGLKGVRVETLYRIARGLSVSVHWLVTGEGQMYAEYRPRGQSAD